MRHPVRSPYRQSCSIWFNFSGQTKGTESPPRNLTIDTLANLAKAAKAVAAAVGGLASAAGEAFKKVIKDEKISPAMLVLCLITGALQGYKVGADIPDAVIRQKVEAMTKSCQALRYGNFFALIGN